MNLPQIEEKILKFWEENKIFEKSLEKRKNARNYVFYDGPPFATGTPHYGHIVASAMKDVVPRYWTMKGRLVERKWGWDCHGLPIENIAEKELGITRKKEIEEMGVEKFNETCRSKVLSYVNDWKTVIKRLGRWVDMENSYKTMDLDFMESVWWVFKELWDKGFIYEGYRSMHICTRCETTLSQSEVAEGYRTIKDLSATVKFKLNPGQKIGGFTTDDNIYVLAWTTTPWTLLGNVALAAGNEIEYVKARILPEADFIPAEYKEEFVILAKNALRNELKTQSRGDIKIYSFGQNNQYTLEVDENKIFKGEALVGLKYKPLFDYYVGKGLQNEENGWKIYAGDFVATEEGTGIVHIAPAFGEDDMNLGKKYSLPFIQHVGMDGVIKKKAGEFAGMNVKSKDDHQKTDVEIIKYLAKKNLLFAKEKYEHSYPHCWRCDTPLINYAASSLFVNVLKIKNKALELAENINWSPRHIKEGRFGNWLSGARDWSISRQRFWASVIPIWKCECGETRVFGSARDLEKASGKKIIDLHKHIVDKITFKCVKCGGEMRRVPDVLDTWFDSGSMPFAQMHYPFENKAKFDDNFPAEFIGEGIDQTRCWFYYLHIIGVAVKNSHAFKNVIASGIVLAEDGKKMSKRLKNYPDPMVMFNKYGADVLRFYLLSSPVMAAETLNFKESEVAELARGAFRMLLNSYSFFSLYADADKTEAETGDLKLKNLLDKWIISKLNVLIKKVGEGMDNYELNVAARLFPQFIDELSNWHIRRSRGRFLKPKSDEDREEAQRTLYVILLTLSKLMAPFTPFISEYIYKELGGKEESVHLCDWPEADEKLIDKELEEKMKSARDVVALALAERAALKIKVRQPLASLKIKNQSADWRTKIKNSEELLNLIKEEVNVKEIIFDDAIGKEVELDKEISPRLKEEGIIREVVHQVQDIRKKAGLKPKDKISVYYSGPDFLNGILAKNEKMILSESKIKDLRFGGKNQVFDIEKELIVDGQKLWIGIKKA